MVGLARSDVVTDDVELRRLLNREKIIMGMFPSKVVLSSDFFVAALNVDEGGNLRPHKAFSDVFGRHAEKISGSSTLKESGVLFVPYSKLAKSDKEKICKLAAEHVDERIEEAKKVGQQVEMFAGHHHPDFEPIPATGLLPEVREKFILGFAKIFNVQAFLLRDVVQTMDEARFWRLRIGGRISRYENHSLKNGEGAEALQFWKRVNDLHDYGDLFESPPPDKGAKIPIMDRIEAGAENFIDGLQPQPVPIPVPIRD